MFRKNEEACGEWSPENVELCAERQDTILDSAAQMLQNGGLLVYSTCTFAPQENNQPFPEAVSGVFHSEAREAGMLFPGKAGLDTGACSGNRGYHAAVAS